jgi:drug/metabolite transporter (DMT)-like permease
MLDLMGAVLCLFSAACFGAMAIFGKFAYDAGVSPAALVLVRFVMAAVVLGAVLVVRRIPVRLPGRVLAVAVGLGAFGYATQATLFFSALQRMDASLLSLILYTYPILVTVGAVLLGRERLTRRRLAALLAASAGTLLVLAGAGGAGFRPVGVLMAAGAAITYTVYILIADTIVDRVPPLVLSTLVMGGAAGSLGGRALLTGGVGLGFGAAGWFWLGCIAVVSTVLAMAAFFAGLRRTSPSTAAILSTFEPVVTTGLAALAFGESLTPVQLAGGLLVLSSAVVLQMPSRKNVFPSTRRRCGNALNGDRRRFGDAGRADPAETDPGVEAGHVVVGGGEEDRRRAGVERAVGEGGGELGGVAAVPGRGERGHPGDLGDVLGALDGTGGQDALGGGVGDRGEELDAGRQDPHPLQFGGRQRHHGGVPLGGPGPERDQGVVGCRVRRGAETEPGDGPGDGHVVAEGGRGGIEYADGRAGHRKLGEQRGRLEDQQRGEVHVEAGRAGDREHVRCGLVDPFERLGNAELSLTAAGRSNIGGGRRLRPEPGAGVIGPSFTLADEEHETAETLCHCVRPGDGVIETLEPDKDVDIRLRHRARLPNHGDDGVTAFPPRGVINPNWRRSVALTVDSRNFAGPTSSRP